MAIRSSQLSLVPRHTKQPGDDSATRRLFDRWLLLFGKNPLRTAYSPARRKLLDTWLLVYGEAGESTLTLALDGAACNPWVAETGGQVTSLEWLFENEARIERFCEEGERAHEQMRRASVAADRAGVMEQAPPTAAEAAAQLEVLRQWAAARTGRALR